MAGKKKKVPPKAPPKQKIDKTPVWISCRATQGCEGRQAVMTLKGNIAQGRYIRYKCLTCNRAFNIVY